MGSSVRLCKLFPAAFTFEDLFSISAISYDMRQSTYVNSIKDILFMNWLTSLSHILSIEHGARLPGPILRRHPTLYFDTGDVVICVDQEESKHLFCVHKSILAHNSPVFKDMFRLPLGANVNDMYEDMPMVHLHDDVSDIEVFLRALYSFRYAIPPFAGNHH